MTDSLHDVACLVTGGAGFIGSHVAEALVKAGARVRVLDDLSSGRTENLAHLSGHLEFIQGDIRDLSLVERTLQGVELVFHLAALPSVVFSVEHPVESFSVNWQGTLNLAQLAVQQGVRRIIFSSSCAVYGPKASGALAEDRLPQPASPYATAKMAVEYLLANYRELYGLETVCLRYFNIFGPRQDPDSPYGAVIPLFIKALSTGCRPVIYGDGQQTRDFVTVEQVAWTNLRSAFVPSGTVVNVGTGRQTSVRDILDSLCRVMDSCIEPRMEPERSGDIRHSLADPSHNLAVFGEFDGPDLDTALARTAAWFTGSR